MFAVPEMVEDEKNGFIIKSPVRYFKNDFTPNRKFWNMDITDYCMKNNFPDVRNKLISKISELIKNRKRLEKMSSHSLSLAKRRFSEKKRQESLLKVYKKAVDN